MQLTFYALHCLCFGGIATSPFFLFEFLVLNNHEDEHRYRYYSPYSEQIEDTEECPICLSLLNQHTYAMKSCIHRFHRSCIEQWQRETLGPQALCPVCRSPFTL
ncbi:RING-H2 finger protein ATL63-like isoform X2 [Ceratina calcarata]|uniref:RING-H2 finger protein ATL63-like isoform X2 n=1 Tax=Ceratina calcarata TaxID=156304 RepID=A0AAJ7IVS0_9HYME|nr:RING-H2 finger protein ATL63-like isoform X2 [Ceratina calcarata]